MLPTDAETAFLTETGIGPEELEAQVFFSFYVKFEFEIRPWIGNLLDGFWKIRFPAQQQQSIEVSLRANSVFSANSINY